MSIFQSWGYRSEMPHTTSYVGAWNPNSVPHICAASSLPVVPCPQLALEVFQFLSCVMFPSLCIPSCQSCHGGNSSLSTSSRGFCCGHRDQSQVPPSSGTFLLWPLYVCHVIFTAREFTHGSYSGHIAGLKPRTSKFPDTHVSAEDGGDLGLAQQPDSDCGNHASLPRDASTSAHEKLWFSGFLYFLIPGFEFPTSKMVCKSKIFLCL